MCEVGRSAYADTGDCFWEKAFREQYVELASLLCLQSSKRKILNFCLEKTRK